MVSNGSTIELYIDGVSQGPTAYTGGGTATALQIASRFGDGTRGIDAVIDDVEVWNETLSSDDMAYYAANFIPEPVTSGLPALFAAAVFFIRRKMTA